MKSHVTYIVVAFFFLTFSLKFQWNAPSFDLSSDLNSTLTCPNPCQTTDSLALVAIFNATQGPGWSNTWNLNLPVCTPWTGVELDNDGYVVRITIDNNNLIGMLPPEIGDFARLEELQIDNNNLSGSIPPEIGSLSELELCFLDDNDFTGTIPEELGNLSVMHTLYIDNNNLVGAVPNSFLNLMNLFKFDLFNNQIDSIPDLSSTNLQPNKFRLYNNNLTFDDIVLNNLNAIGTNYFPQDSVNQALSLTLQTGSSYTYDLGFDSGIVDNSYQWYKDGVPFGAPTNSNKLLFSPVDWSDAGVYRAQVTNPNAPLLTLHTRPVTINIICGVSVYEISDTLCSGEEMEFNNITYNEANPDGFELLSGQDQYGCDSIIEIILTFREANIVELNDVICNTDSITVNGTVYNENNPSGTELLPMPDQYGCDSIVEVDLSFYSEAAAGNLSPTICPGDSIELFGIFYSQTSPSGSVILNNATGTGCDSTIFIEVLFHNPASGTYNPTVCEGGDLNFGGETFNEANPSGTVNLGGIAQNGCDSIVEVSLSFYGPSEGTYEDNLCFGDSVIVNNTVYNQANPSGLEMFPSGNANQCDSVVFVNLTFNSEITEFITSTFCPGDSIIVNGTTYNEDNPAGEEMIPGGSTSGCDSTVNINLSFHVIDETAFFGALCAGDSVDINGTIYNQSNLIGTEIFASSITGCDSIIYVNFDLLQLGTEEINLDLCSGDSIVVNNVIYNEANPTGLEVLPNASSNGCDSIISIDLEFSNEIFITFDPWVCPDSSFIINNVTYDVFSTTGTEVMQTANGCDSTIFVDINYFPHTPNIITETLCEEQGMVINGNFYNQNNPSGLETVENGTVNGCDSLIVIDLTFIPAAEGLLNPTLCQGDSVVINGVVYNQNNPTGIQYFENQAANGCDSLVNIDLTFYSPTPTIYSDLLCPGDSIIINGITYNQSNPSGTEILENASVDGCDSIVIVSLVYIPILPTVLDDVLCESDEIMVNNQSYNIDNPSGLEIMSGANGCDSVIIVELTFNNEVQFTLNPNLCPGDSVIVNNTVYNENNLSGSEFFLAGSANGCDSIVIIDLNYLTPPVNQLEMTLCETDSILVNNVKYDFSNATGTETIFNSASNGCDSIVQVNLSFHPAASGTLNPTICQGESFEFNGSTFDGVTPSGSVILENASSNGCDSTVLVEISFFDLPQGNLSPTICQGESFVFNGNTFDSTTPTGSVVLENASSNGCDSTVFVEISFFNAPTGNLSPTICQGESFVFNGNTFDNDTPSGNVILENASSNGCDSTVFVEISFFNAPTGNLSPTICQGESFMFNGNTFDNDTPSGNVVLENASSNGCDSTVLVEVSFFAPPQGTFSPTICDGGSILYNGTLYDQNHTVGTEILENAGINGCDSIVEVSINFSDAITFETTASICEGSSFEIAGQTFTQFGTYEILLENAASLGCDSTIILQLQTVDPSTLGLAEAGDDLEQCENIISLEGNSPTGSTGFWSSMNSLTIDNPQNNLLEIDNLDPGTYTFVWTLSNGQCFDYHADSVNVTIQAPPIANDDSYLIDLETSSATFNFLENDEFADNPDWVFELMSDPSNGTITEIEEGTFQFDRTNPLGGVVILEYQICSEDCPDLCNTASVTIQLEEQDIDDLDIPNAITPNGDNVNELFMFPQLEFYPDRYPDKELIIFNRWGDIIFEAKPYLNDWRGQDKNGNDLPQGTYYYVLRLNIADGIILKGDVSIFR